MKENNQLQIFKNDEFGNVSILVKDGLEWFVGNEIAKVLGYSNYRKAVSTKIDEEDKLRTKIRYAGQNREITLINESGLYSLILSSRLSSAKKFKRWVTSDVLPSIRKHGMYAKDELLDNPDLLIEVATKLKQEKELRLKLEEENNKKDKIIKHQQPKVVIADRFTNDNNAYDMKLFCKVLSIPKMGRNNMFKWLRNIKILMLDNQPYQRYMDLDYFKVIMLENNFNDKKTPKTLVKSKGIKFIVKKLIKNGYIITKTVDEILKELDESKSN